MGVCDLGRLDGVGLQSIFESDSSHWTVRVVLDLKAMSGSARWKMWLMDMKFIAMQENYLLRTSVLEGVV